MSATTCMMHDHTCCLSEVLCDSTACLSPLGPINNIFNVTVDVGVREVTCQFLNDPVTPATCTIQYGTDPTYVNLSNTDSSTGTNVNSVTVPLSTPLQTDTLYYYIASAMGVRMQGTFHSGVCHWYAPCLFMIEAYVLYLNNEICSLKWCPSNHVIRSSTFQPWLWMTIGSM